MLTIAEQMSASVEVSQQARQYIEDMMGEKLRATAIAAQAQLNPDISKVTNEELVVLSKELGIDNLTLWSKLDNDIVALKSSNPKEINLSSKSWDYWYAAFLQLFDKHNVTIQQGQRLPNYWSGPINFSTSDPSIINKWGNYYDGTTNYMINPYMNAKTILDFQQTAGTEAIVNKLLQKNPNIVEITGFDPDFIGKAPIIKIKQGIPVYNLDVRDVIFGAYTYKDEENDVVNIHKTIQTGEIITTEANLNGKHIIKSFIPVKENHPYVIGINFDRSAIDQVLNHQLFVQCMISLGLWLVTMVTSYFMAGLLIRPIHQILGTVNEVAAGNFGTLTSSRRNDELGLLSSRVNTMTLNLRSYTTQLKEAAEELRNTKEYLESLVNHTSDAIHVSDLQGNVTQANKAFETMYGWGLDEVLGKPLTNIPEPYYEEYNDKVLSMLQGHSVADYETIRYDKDGRLLDVSITISPIRDEMGIIVAVASITRNITTRKQTEEVLRRSEKLSLIGQLAAGVAHEIRNPLTTLKGFVQLQKQLKGPLKESYLDIMLTELDRINFIVGEFLVLAKPQATHFQLADIRDILKDMGMLLELQAILNNVEIDLQFAEEVPLIHCEVNQLKQVFINVLKNAIEAMPDSGKIIIELFSPNSDHVVIRVTDQGCGIPEEYLKRVGEPFFTIKENGNGLGIMVTQRIINNHKGSITIQSTPGEGTCVEIILPCAPVEERQP
ncbi:PAS domain S-box protein [Paenibacillus sp. LMG 31456]|uniref:histidine kinase n=2 Tax=Paenibacillus foliorum TaxID=2654974 RepID=A0A972K2J4_9BACL|nr:PAS domain S-box protein [Paenibacillus foliorum]